MAVVNAQTGTIPTGQGYDAQYDEAVNGIKEKLATLRSSTDISKQRLDQDIDEQKATLARGHEETLSTLRERLANQGIIRSGVNIGEQGRIGTEVARKYGEIQQGRTRSLEDIERNFAQEQQSANSELQRLNIQRTRREEERQERLAMEEADRKANEELANNFRAQMDEMKEKLIKATQPQPTPTGQMQLPPPIPKPQPPAPPPPMNLGRPPVARPPQPPGADIRDNVSIKDLQEQLRAKGFDPGPSDGLMGPKTQRALQEWKKAAGMPVNAIVDAGIMQTLNFWQRQFQAPGYKPPGIGRYT